MLPALSRLRSLEGRCLYYSTRPRLALFDAHRRIESARARDQVADVAAALLRLRAGKLAGNGTSGGVSVPSDAAEQLRVDGLVRLPNLLTGAQIDEVVQWLDGRSCTSTYEPEQGRFLPSNPPPDVHIGAYDAETIIAAPHLLSVANDPGLLKIAEDFLGAKPTISNLSLWWSFPRVSEAKEAQLFHRDVDDLRFCKVFVYMTDVDMDSGPHVFVHGSPRAAACRTIRRYGDDEVRQAFGDAATEYLCGPRGTSFIANTLGVHKGLTPRHTIRLLFQVQYSLFPLMSSTYQPARPPSGFHGDPYVNRLYVG